MILLLLLTSLLWVGIHVGIAGTEVRGRLSQQFGEVGFRVGYSVASLMSLVLLVLTYKATGVIALWTLPIWLIWILALLMLPAFVLFVASVAAPNPTAVGGKLGEAGPVGITRITRHPMLWSFTIWAAVHLLVNGDLASFFFFGAFLVTAVVGMPSIDRKLAAGNPTLWAALAPTTSILPFGAILTGRNKLVIEEIPRWVLIAGAVIWLLVTLTHHWIIGVSALGFSQ